METPQPIEILSQNQEILNDLVVLYKGERSLEPGEKMPTKEDVLNFVNDEIVPSLVKFDVNEKGRRKDLIVRLLTDANIEVPTGLLHA